MMKLTKEECELALEEYDFRSERPLPHEYRVLRQLINEYFDNPPLEFEEIEEGKWYWDNHCKEYFRIDKIHKELQSLNINIDEEDGVCEVKYYEKDRFYHREVKDDKNK